MQLTVTEENYLKALVHQSFLAAQPVGVGTNELADILGVKPATVTDMARRLSEKQLVLYQRYSKIQLTDVGREVAMKVVRKHRLWETFLHQHLGFEWHQVHAIAEQLEHVQSDELIDRLDAFLGFPTTDPHGDAIPLANGAIEPMVTHNLATEKEQHTVKVIGVSTDETSFLEYIQQMDIQLGAEITVQHRNNFDKLVSIQVNGREQVLSEQLATKILVKCSACGH
ncbi:MAG: metal-dependent transcriptional regulator [Bacteroidetes bacterium]|nr:MAG: metal-dependent transcriptional regulator [Bacteroidota bacterium]TAF93271.1 MAG: metal-dependent transcriptional regulator [Bacteroidota bacterium]